MLPRKSLRFLDHVISIPTAPTNHPFSQQQLSDLSRRQKAAIRASRVAPMAPASWKVAHIKSIGWLPATRNDAVVRSLSAGSPPGAPAPGIDSRNLTHDALPVLEPRTRESNLID